MNDFPNPAPQVGQPAPSFLPQMPQAPKQATPLERAFDTLGDKCSALEKAVATLIDRISPVLAPLAPQAPQQPGAPKPATPPCSDVVRVVNSQSDKLAALIARVDTAIARVEL